MGYAISIDWSKEWENPDKWINHGRNALEEGCKHKTQDKDSSEDNRETNVKYSGWCDECGMGEDSAQPMMNFLYPLEMDSFSEEEILKVVNETNCTVMENDETGEWFLTLCGGGMDLSQDIAYAYMIMEKWIPMEFLSHVCKQPELSIGGNHYKELAAAMIEQLEMRGEQLKAEGKRWKERLEAWEAKNGITKTNG